MINFLTKKSVYEIKENGPSKSEVVIIIYLFFSTWSEKNHPVYPEFSSKVELCSHPEVGRHTIASQDIAPFETVLAEDAFASVLYPSKAGMNCWHCLRRFKTAMPCQFCSGVAFCSLRCRDESQATYHQWECQFQVCLCL